MNEFIVKKLAEVRAFIDLSNQISEKGGVPLAQDFPEVALNLQTISQLSLPPIGNHKDIFDTKVQRTTAKLQSMMELYVGDEWDNAVEVLEWLSFYAGSASAHAALVAAALKKIDSKHAADAAKTSELFWQLLVEVRDSLAATGARRV